MLQSQSTVESSEILQSPGVIQSLVHVRERVKEQLIKVPEYRAFLAIETSIAEVSNIPDLVVCLEAAKQKIMDRLMTVREYQAMLAVDKSIKEISEVLGVLGGDENYSGCSRDTGGSTNRNKGAHPHRRCDVPAAGIGRCSRCAERLASCVPNRCCGRPPCEGVGVGG
jgi:hypothetical protein